jgi:hypothetical protein
MWPYWLLFLIPAAAAVLKPKPRFAPASFDPTRWGLEWLLVLVLLALMIGFGWRWVATGATTFATLTGFRVHP